MPRGSADDPAEELLAGLDGPVRELVASLRAAIRSHVPGIEERVNLGWEGFGYHVPSAGYVLGLFAKDGYVEAGFEHGAELDDREGLFHRGGKQMRFVRFNDADTDRIEALLRMLDTAIAMRQRG